MDSNSQEYWCRSNRILICRQPAAAVTRFNDAARQITRRITGNQRRATPAAKITDCFAVFDVERKQYHLILVYRVDYRPGFPPNVGKVVKFSKSCHAPCRSKDLWLATPTCYQDQKTLPRGIADPRDSTLTRNATPWMRSRFPYGSIEAEVVFSSSSEPWLYCTSHFQSQRVYKELRSTFSDEFDYDAATEIKDVNGFAMWLGGDFALQVDKGEHLKLNALETLVYRRSSYCIDLWKQEGARNIDTVVRVYHGPVHYEDESGVIETEDDWVDINGAPRAWFTKRTEFAYQSEYRFAISTLGNPTVDVFKLDVSDDLRQLTLAM